MTTGVSSLELKNSTGHILDIAKLESPISIKLPCTHDLTNSSRSQYVGANDTAYNKINVTQTGMTLILKVRPENNATELLVLVKYGQPPTLSDRDLDATVPNFSSCVWSSSDYVNCSRDPYVVFLSNKLVSRTGYYFIGIKIKARSGSRKRRCSGEGRSRRSCVEDKETPVTDVPNVARTIHAPKYSRGDVVYTMQALPAACLYWSTAVSKWTAEGCRVKYRNELRKFFVSRLCSLMESCGFQLSVVKLKNPLLAS